MLDTDEAGSHHGSPILRLRDTKLLADYTLWVQTARASQPNNYRADWLPSNIDWLKSRLFWRIRSGKKPLEHAPPTCWSCPWYELIEDLGPHGTAEKIYDGIGVTTVATLYKHQGLTGDCASVAQDIYRVVRKESDSRWILAYGPWQFTAWNGTRKAVSIAGTGIPHEIDVECGWIQRTPDTTGVEHG